MLSIRKAVPNVRYTGNSQSNQGLFSPGFRIGSPNRRPPGSFTSVPHFGAPTSDDSQTDKAPHNECQCCDTAASISNLNEDGIRTLA